MGLRSDWRYCTYSRLTSVEHVVLRRPCSYREQPSNIRSVSRATRRHMRISVAGSSQRSKQDASLCVILLDLSKHRTNCTLPQGAMSTAWVMEAYGRRTTLFIAGFWFVVGSVLQIVCKTGGQSDHAALIQVRIQPYHNNFGIM